METSRRGFIGGVAGLALAGTASAAAETPRSLRPALDAIRDHAEGHRRYFNLPALTLSVIAADGFSTTMELGLADPEARERVTPATLFQIGSISKLMVGATFHQLAAAGRLRLDADVRTLLPEAPWPARTPISVQQLLDHVSGIADSPPAFPADGTRLWLGFRPGSHWSYCNTGYFYLGLMLERIERKPLARILHERLFAPLGMSATHGAISGEDRGLYAVAYQPLDMGRPYIRGTPLAAAPWIEETSGAGCVASTAADMALFLHALAGAAQGRGGLGLGPAQGRAYTSHFVPSDNPNMSYGNGLMRIVEDGRPVLHHTGGMVGFSSSFHLDVGDGVGAFASSTISGFCDYRPRRLTLFAVKALRAAQTGAPIPAPPPFEPPFEHAADFVGRYSGPEGGFEIRAGDGLTLISGRREARLDQADEDVLKTGHPAYRDWPIRFERAQGRIVGAGWGPNIFVRDGAAMAQRPSDPALARLAGRYVNDSPWLGVTRIVERGGRLWYNGATPMTPLGEGLWRVGKDDWSPERARFANVVAGRPRTLVFSGEPFDRRDV